MKKILFLLLLLPSLCFADTIEYDNPPLNVTDGTVSSYPYKLVFPSGSLTNFNTGTVVDFGTITHAWGGITGTLSNQTDLQNALNAKQDLLVSGTNIKTINGSSILTSGDLTLVTTETDPLSLHLDQTTPQSVINGAPTFDSGLISNGRIGIFNSTQPTDVALRIYATDSTNDAISIRQASANSSGPEIRLTKARGSHASYGGVSSGDTLGAIRFRGYDTTNFFAGSYIQSSATETWSGTAHGGKIDFYTVPNTTIIPGLSMTLNQDKTATFSTAIIDNGYLDMLGIANPTSPSAGTARFHASTANGFTRFEQDNEATTNLILGRDEVIVCKVDNGGPITKGQVVYVKGTASGVPTVALARANSATTMPALGFMMDTTADGGFGQVMKIGILNNVNTSTFSEGVPLYVSTSTAGGLQTTRPSGTTVLVQRLGTILSQNATTGSIEATVSAFVGNMETGTISNWTGAGTVTGTQFISNITYPTPPLAVTSTAPVLNLSIGGNSATSTTAPTAAVLATGTVTGATSQSQAFTNGISAGNSNQFQVSNTGAVLAVSYAGSAENLTSFPTLNQNTTGKSAKTDALNSATTVVNVSSATAPSSGQVLTATSSTAATWQTPSSGGATTALDNLASTAVNASIIPASDNAVDLGSSTPKNWRNIYSLIVTTPAVKFPATQVQSADANTLDDYEEGTWTISDNSGASLTFTSNTGEYIKIGQLVIAYGDFIYPSTANGSNSKISLPFTPHNIGAGSGGSCAIGFLSYATPTMGYINTTADFGILTNNPGAVALTNANLSSKEVAFCAIYRTSG